MTSILVLGAGGYVGGAIAKALAADGLHRVIGGSRRPPSRPVGPGIETRICDATDAASIAKAAEGVRCIVNAVLGDEATMLAACRSVCAALGTSGGGRIVHVSSMAVYGPAHGRVTESSRLDAAGSPYGAAKIACERVMDEFIAAGGDAVILRPGIVHGPGGQQWTGRLGRMLRRGRLGDLGEGADGRCNLTYIDDIGAAARAAVERPEARGEAFHVSDASPPTWNQYLIALGVMVGATPVRRLSARRMRLEAKLLAPPLQILKLLGGRFGMRAGGLPEPIPPSLLTLFAQDMELDTSKADRVLGFARTPREQAMADSAAWFRAAHGG